MAVGHEDQPMKSSSIPSCDISVKTEGLEDDNITPIVAGSSQNSQSQKQ